MVSPNVAKILQAEQTLNDVERQELRRLLEARAKQQSEANGQDQFRQALIERGIVEARPASGKDVERFRRWRPVPIKGKPLSTTIIEERR